MKLWPQSELLISEPVLMFTVSSETDTLLIDSLTKYPLVLVSKSDTVQLVLVDRYINEFNLTKYLIQVERPLQIGQKYHLSVINHLDSEDYLNHLTYIGISPRNHEWLIVNNIKFEKPEFLSHPKKVSYTYNRLGCGPESFDTYSIDCQSPDYTFVEVSVMRGDKELKTLVVINDNTINVGFGMCNGQYLFNESEEYDISFTLINIFGQRSDTKYLKNMVSPKWDKEVNKNIFMR